MSRSGLTVEVDGQLFRLSGDRVVIGRAPDCDVIVTDESVSRQHLEVVRDSGEWVARDLASSNGSWYSDRRFTQLDVVAPIRIRLGETDGPFVVLRPDAAGVRDRAFSYSELTSSVQDAAQTISVQARQKNSKIHIGRDPSNDLCLDDVQVSRRHAVAEWRSDGSVLLRDLRSSNGTFVDGRRVIEQVLHPESTIVVGTTILRLSPGGFDVFTDSGRLTFDVVDLLVRGGDGHPILSDVNLAIPPRSLVAVLGPSGAGKSTFVKAIVGATPVAGGEVRFGGVDLVRNLDSTRRAIGYVPQDDILHDPLSVADSLRYAARLRLPADITPDEIEEQVALVLHQLNLTEHRMKLVSQLSGGQRKRVSTAMELLTEPLLLFLDEPSSGLDPGNEKSLMQLLRDLAHEDSETGGRRIIVVTHSVQSLELCDYVLVLRPGSRNKPGGRLAYFGPPATLLSDFGTDDPADVFQMLERGEAPEWRITDPSLLPEPLDSSVIPNDEVTPGSPLSWGQQFSLLASRYWRILLSDWRNVLLLAAQAPLIGVLLAVVSTDAFRPLPGTPASKVVLLLLGLVLSITYLGTSNSVREVVKERPIFLRERALGLSESAYLASKTAVLLAVTIPQAVVLTLVGVAIAGSATLPSELAWFQSPILGLLAVVTVTGVVAVLVGLLISSVVTSADKAMSLLPVVLLGLYFMSNGPAKLDGIPIVEQVSYLNPVRWGLANTAMVVDAQDLLLCKGVNPDQLGPSPNPRCREDWAPLLGRFLLGIGVLLTTAAASGIAGTLVLRRRRF